MLADFGDFESDLNVWIERFDFLRIEIRLRLEGQLVDAGGQFVLVREQVGNATVCVCCSFADCIPTVVGEELEHRLDTNARLAFARVQHMRGDRAHYSFSNLNSVIFFCSSAAFANSVSLSFFRRCCRISSISPADLPVAQTMKRCPYFFS